MPMSTTMQLPRAEVRRDERPPAPAPAPAPHDGAARAVGAAGLFGVALIHFLDVFDKFKETPYVGVLYVALIAGCLAAAGRLVHRGDRTAWMMASTLAALTFAAYAVSRTIGLPASTDDIGNWL